MHPLNPLSQCDQRKKVDAFEDSLILTMWSTKLPLEKFQYVNFLLQVMEMFRPKLVLILTSHKAHEHLSCYPKESDSGPTHTLRALQSSMWKLEPVSHHLEAPNTIIGEAAAGMIWPP